MIYIFIAILTVLLIAAACSPGKDDAQPGTGSSGAGTATGKTCTETYTANVPYNKTEFYYEDVCVGRMFCEAASYTDFDMRIESLGKVCNIYITNTGNLSGDWTMVAKFITTNSGGGPESEPQTQSIDIGDSKKFSFQYPQSDTPSSCVNVNNKQKVPTTEVCKCGGGYTKAKKSRTIVDYRDEQKTRDVPC